MLRESVMPDGLTVDTASAEQVLGLPVPPGPPLGQLVLGRQCPYFWIACIICIHQLSLVSQTRFTNL